MTNEPTTGELDRRFDRLERSIQLGFDKIDARLDKMVGTEVFTLNQQANDRRFAALEADVVQLRADDDKLRDESVSRTRHNIQIGVAILVALIGALAGVLPILL